MIKVGEGLKQAVPETTLLHSGRTHPEHQEGGAAGGATRPRCGVSGGSHTGKATQWHAYDSALLCVPGKLLLKPQLH